MAIWKQANQLPSLELAHTVQLAQNLDIDSGQINEAIRAESTVFPGPEQTIPTCPLHQNYAVEQDFQLLFDQVLLSSQ